MPSRSPVVMTTRGDAARLPYVDEQDAAVAARVDDVWLVLIGTFVLVKAQAEGPHRPPAKC